MSTPNRQDLVTKLADVLDMQREHLRAEPAQKPAVAECLAEQERQFGHLAQQARPWSRVGLDRAARQEHDWRLNEQRAGDDPGDDR